MNATNETYRQHERMILKICSGFQRAYGGDFDELLSTANLAFLAACRTHDGARGKLTTHAWHCVSNALKGHYRAEAKRPKQSEGFNLDYAQDRRQFDLGAFVGELSPDGAAAATLAVRSSARGNRKNALAELLQDLGWAAERIVESFREIGEALP